MVPCYHLISKNSIGKSAMGKFGAKKNTGGAGVNLFGGFALKNYGNK